MGRNRSTNTQKSVRDKICKGYGRGRGIGYKPWLSGHEFASMGVYTRMMGLTIPRMYVFFSRLESDLFVIYDTDPEVEDILEQYYMDLPTTLRLAQSMGIRHPWSGQYYNVMTADLLFLKNGRWHARSVKSSSELNKPRTVEKLRLEQAYFNEAGIPWSIVTEKEINPYKVQNLRWLYYTTQFEELVPCESLRKQCSRLFYELYMEELQSLPDVIDCIESLYSIPEGTGIAILKSLIRQEKIPFDIEKPINLNDPVHPAGRRLDYGRYNSYG